jgi:hypothetical protein
VKKESVQQSPFLPDPLLGARVRFHDRQSRGWPWCEGIVVVVEHSLIVSVGNQVHIVSRESAQLLQTVLQGVIYW